MVFLIGETIPDGTREFIAERLGARSAGIYSCQEIGAIACECEAAPHYHVAAENALVEILDESGRDVAPGGRGRVVVTGFYNYAMPFIRYELGDLAEAGSAPCGCGRAAPIIARIEGRSRHAFIFRDGTRLWPRAAMVDRCTRSFRSADTSSFSSITNESSFATSRTTPGASPISPASRPVPGGHFIPR
jgi:phenylacetate-CoA ligase